MATAGRKGSMVRDAAAGAARTRATRKKAEGVAASATKGTITHRTGAMGGKRKPNAVETGGRKLKSAATGMEGLDTETGSMRMGTKGEKTSTARMSQTSKRAGGAGGQALGTKRGMKQRDLDSGPQIQRATHPGGSRSKPVTQAKPRGAKTVAGKTATVTSRNAAVPSGSIGAARSSTARARMAAAVSTGPKGGGALSTAKAGGAKKTLASSKSAGRTASTTKSVTRVTAARPAAKPATKPAAKSAARAAAARSAVRPTAGKPAARSAAKPAASKTARKTSR